MISEIALELLQSIGRFFLHPLFYLGILLTLLIGIRRVKRERADFHIKVYDFVEELVSSIKPSLIVGVVLSVFFVGIGIVLPPSILLLVAGAYVLLSFTFTVRLLSPVYVLALTLIILFVFDGRTFTLPLLGEITFTSNHETLFQLFLFFTLMLFAESALIRYFAHKNTSPRLFLSMRGKYVGGHEAKKLWTIPVFILVPDGIIPSFMSWPFFSTTTGETYSLMLVPVLISFHHIVKYTLPKESMRQMSRRVFLFAFCMLLIAVGGYFYPVLLIIGAFIGLLVREGLTVLHKMTDDGKMSLFRLRKKGVIVLGILPHSPAEKIGIQIGEVIEKVNGVEVNHPHEFYKALQKKAASCQLDVIDRNGEKRIVQTALYDGEHHELGILLLKADYEYQDTIV